MVFGTVWGNESFPHEYHTPPAPPGIRCAWKDAKAFSILQMLKT